MNDDGRLAMRHRITRELNGKPAARQLLRIETEKAQQSGMA